MRIALLAEGGYPYATGEGRGWADRLVRGLDDHEFEVYGLSVSAEQEAAGLVSLPRHVTRLRTAPLWGPPEASVPGGLGSARLGRRERRLFAEYFADFAAALTADEPEADRFTAGLYGLAELAADTSCRGGLSRALRSEQALRLLEAACRAPGSSRLAQRARLADLLIVGEELERGLRPLSLDWMLDGVDLSHALTSGPAALPGLLAKRFRGTPLLVTEYGVRVRRHYLQGASSAQPAPARALLASFHRQLAAEVYAQAALLTPGNTHARKWQEQLGAERSRQRTVYPGMESERFAAVGETVIDPAAEDRTLVWVGRIDPSKDLIGLLHAFAEVRKAEPDAHLRIVNRQRQAPRGDHEYLAHCRALAAQLFPDEAEHAHAVGDNPVSFEEIGGPELPDLAAAYAAGGVLVLSSVVEGFPAGLVEGMFCGRASVSTDVGAVREVIGGTGLVVPPRNPRALAEACLNLLRDGERRARLGAAARARALELFTVEQNIAAFRGSYLELMSRMPTRPPAPREGAEPKPFANPAESHVPGRWAAGGRMERSAPSWREPVGAGTQGGTS